MIRQRTNSTLSQFLTFFQVAIITSRKDGPTGTATRWSKKDQVLHRELAQEEVQEKRSLGYPRQVHQWWKIPQKHGWIGSSWGNMSWDGQIGGRKQHAQHHSRRNSCVQKQLVDSFEHSWFRHDAGKTSSWFQRSIVYLATSQEPKRWGFLPTLAKLFFILVELARFLMTFFIWVSARRWTKYTVIGPSIRVMILDINLMQNYSENSVTTNSKLLSSIGGVKSIPPTTENWPRKVSTYSLNNNKSNEDKYDTNYINNKYTNTYTRKLHSLRACTESALFSSSHLEVCVTCTSRLKVFLSFISSTFMVIQERFPLTSTSFLVYFDLSFTILFHFWLLMHPEQHTEFDNLITMQLAHLIGVTTLRTRQLIPHRL